MFGVDNKQLDEVRSGPGRDMLSVPGNDKSQRGVGGTGATPVGSAASLEEQPHGGLFTVQRTALRLPQAATMRRSGRAPRPGAPDKAKLGPQEGAAVAARSGGATASEPLSHGFSGNWDKLPLRLKGNFLLTAPRPNVYMSQ